MTEKPENPMNFRDRAREPNTDQQVRIFLTAALDELDAADRRIAHLEEKMERAVSAAAHFTHRYNEDLARIAELKRELGATAAVEHSDDAYRVGRTLGTTIYNFGEDQPCVWVPDNKALARKIVELLNRAARNDGEETSNANCS